eukprot:scaffold83026_cov25-Prasinocladus_malaysianus.AAC.2
MCQRIWSRVCVFRGPGQLGTATPRVWRSARTSGSQISASRNADRVAKASAGGLRRAGEARSPRAQREGMHGRRTAQGSVKGPAGAGA